MTRAGGKRLLVAVAAAIGLSVSSTGALAAPRVRAERSAARRLARVKAERPVRPLRSTRTRKSRLARVSKYFHHEVARPDRQPKWRSPAQIAGQIRPGDHIYVPIGHSVSQSVLGALLARATAPRSTLTSKNPVHIVGLTNVASRKLFSTGKIVARSVFIGANNRDQITSGKGEFVPTHLSRVPRLIRSGQIPVDVAVIQVSPPDENGIVSLGTSAADSLAALDVAKRVIAEVNPNVPRTYGATEIPLSKIDYLVKSNEPLRPVPPTRISDVDRKIAKNILRLIPEKPTLQFGIGGTTDAVAASLAASGRKDLHVHSEMISDGVMKLVDAGAVQGRVRYSFAMGTEKLIKWMDHNEKLEALPSEVSNDPRKLADIDRLISINTALRVDLNGDANAQYIGNRFYSGVGGQQDFFRGAMMSEGGKAILALPSAKSVTDGHGNEKLISSIVFKLGKDDVVTTSMHDVQYVVTEYGVAHLEGKSTKERAEALIKIAHPSFRKHLRAELAAQYRARRDSVRDKHRSSSAMRANRKSPRAQESAK